MQLKDFLYCYFDHGWMDTHLSSSIIMTSSLNTIKHQPSSYIIIFDLHWLTHLLTTEPLPTYNGRINLTIPGHKWVLVTILLVQQHWWGWSRNAPSSVSPRLVWVQKWCRRILWCLLWHGMMIKFYGAMVDLDEAIWAAGYNNSSCGVEDQSRVGERLRHLKVQILHCHPHTLDDKAFWAERHKNLRSGESEWEAEGWICPGDRFNEFIKMYVKLLKEFGTTKENPCLKRKTVFWRARFWIWVFYDHDEDCLALQT